MNEVEEIKARLDIVDVIGQYVQLQKAGRSFKALCPFHSERTPSFIVSPERQSWHCFGACGAGGDVIAFVMRKEGLEFPEALRMLAQRAGVRLPERRASEEEERARERLRASNEAASQWYRMGLLNGEASRGAREYLERRGVDSAAAEAFHLGFSPAAWEATREQLRQRGFTDAELLAAGLLVEGETGLHDRFRGRLMFPIRDLRGRIIGFGARALDDSLPKYLNTSQTAIFDKGGVLYGLDKAQPAIRREGRAVIVEGYMDVIAAHQHGFDNVVASMGTSITERQVRLLKRLCGQMVLALDADAAGSEAAVRGHDVVREALAGDAGSAAVPVVTWRGLVRYQEAVAVDLRVAVLPQGRDPDDVIHADAEAWRALVEAAKPVLDYRLETSAETHDLSQPRERSQLVREFLPLLGAVADPVVRAHYLQRLSRLALVSERDLVAMLPASRHREPSWSADAAPGASARRGDAREEFLLALLLRYPELRSEGVALAEELVWDSENRLVLAALRQAQEDRPWKEAGQAQSSPGGPGPIPSDGIEAVETALPEELAPHLQRLIERRLPTFSPKEAREALATCRQGLEQRWLRAEKQATAALLAAWEEEVGASALAEASASAMGDDERMKEVVSLQLRDMETGLRLHSGERSEDGGEAAGTTIDG